MSRRVCQAVFVSNECYSKPHTHMQPHTCTHLRLTTCRKHYQRCPALQPRATQPCSCSPAANGKTKHKHSIFLAEHTHIRTNTAQCHKYFRRQKDKGRGRYIHPQPDNVARRQAPPPHPLLNLGHLFSLHPLLEVGVVLDSDPLLSV